MMFALAAAVRAGKSQVNVEAGHVRPVEGGLRERQAIGVRLGGAAGAQRPFQLGRILDEGPLLGKGASRTSTTRGVVVPLPQRRWAAISPMRGRGNIEVGIEGLPAKRAYAWADVLELPRDAFFRFVTGEADRVVIPNAAARQDAGDRITAAETELLASYRKLPPKYQRRLREQAAEFETLSRAASREGKR
jgi:hypothetical protein